MNTDPVRPNGPPEPESTAPHPVMSFGHGLLLGAILGAIAGAFDLGVLLLRAPTSASASLLVGSLALLVFVGGVLGVVAASATAVVEIVARWAPRAIPRWLSRAAVAGGLAFPFLVLLGRMVFAGKGLAHSALSSSGPWILLFGGCFAAGAAYLVLRWLHGRVSRARMAWRILFAAAAGGLSAVLVALERTQHIDAYFYLHMTALLLATIPVLVALSALVPRSRRLAVAGTGAFGAGLVLLLAANPTSTEGGRLLLYGQPLFAGRVVQGVHLLIDRDHDGFSPWLGGGDCDDGNAGVMPLAVDVPGNGVDEDCDGADAESLPTLPVVPACGPAHGPAATRLREALHGKNLLMIVLDAVRGDRLGPGAPADVMPALGEFAKRGVVFRQAYSPAASTAYCVPALLAGVTRLLPGQPTLFERLRAGGYETAFVVLDDSLRVFPNLLDRIEQVLPVATTRKLEVTVGSGVSDPTSADMTDRALAWLDERPKGRPFALVTHYMDAHQWYRIKDPELDRAAAEGGPKGRYDATLRAMDAEVARMLAALEARGALDDTVVVILADHGEAVGDRGVMTHGRHVYPVLTHVPLVVLAPTLEPREVAEVVGLVDLAPTITDLLGLEPLEQADGRSVLPLLLAAPSKTPCTGPYFLEELLQVGVIWGHQMLLVSPVPNTRELLSLPSPDGTVAPTSEDERRLLDILRLRLRAARAKGE